MPDGALAPADAFAATLHEKTRRKLRVERQSMSCERRADPRDASLGEIAKPAQVSLGVLVVDHVKSLGGDFQARHALRRVGSIHHEFEKGILSSRRLMVDQMVDQGVVERERNPLRGLGFVVRDVRIEFVGLAP